MTFSFELLKKEQQDLVVGWLSQDYVAKYWYGKGLQNTLNTIERFVNGQEMLFTLWIAYDGDTPFGYLMTTNVDLEKDHLFAKHCTPNGKAMTLDLLIGNPDYLGKGFGHMMIQQLLLQKFSSMTDVFIDPGVNNSKAIHVYEKAGFEKREEFIPEWDRTDRSLLMQLDMSKLKSIQMIVDEFPELTEEIEEDPGLFHMQISALTRLTQEAIDQGDKVKFKRVCELFRKLFLNASEPVKNALYVSFLEHLNFEDSKKTDRKWAFSMMPKVMQQAYSDIMNYLDELFRS